METEQTKGIKQAIAVGYKNGICDIEGESLDINGVAVAKPRSISGLKYRAIYPKDRPKIVVLDIEKGIGI